MTILRHIPRWSTVVLSPSSVRNIIIMLLIATESHVRYMCMVLGHIIRSETKLMRLYYFSYYTDDRWLSSGWKLMELLVLCSGHNVKNWAEIYYFPARAG